MEDLSSIPGSGRSPEEGNGNSLQYSCLENPMDRGAWWDTVHRVTKSWTRLSNFTFTFHFHPDFPLWNPLPPSQSIKFGHSICACMHTHTLSLHHTHTHTYTLTHLALDNQSRDGSVIPTEPVSLSPEIFAWRHLRIICLQI